MSKLEQKKVYLTLDELKGDGRKVTLDNLLKGVLEPNDRTKWKLVRERDNLTKYSEKIMWLEFNKDRTFKAKHEYIADGYSLLMSPFNDSFTWQTTEVIEITEDRDFHVKFKTKNSNYTLYKI
jgi:hypothetical protein